MVCVELEVIWVWMMIWILSCLMGASDFLCQCVLVFWVFFLVVWWVSQHFLWTHSSEPFLYGVILEHQMLLLETQCLQKQLSTRLLSCHRVTSIPCFFRLAKVE